MFRNRSLQVSVVKDPKPNTPVNTPEAPKVDYIEKIEKSVKEASKVIAGAFIVMKATDTASKMLMHIVATKIQ